LPERAAACHGERDCNCNAIQLHGCLSLLFQLGECQKKTSPDAGGPAGRMSELVCESPAETSPVQAYVSAVQERVASMLRLTPG